MEWLQVSIARATEEGALFLLDSPAYTAQVEHAERSLGLYLPFDYQRFLLHMSNGGVLFHGEDPQESGFHLFGLDDQAYYGLVHMNQLFHALYGVYAVDLLVIGHVPNAGHGRYIAIDLDCGQVKSCAGRPEGGWPTIANGFTEFLHLMFQAFDEGREPIYWLVER